MVDYLKTALDLRIALLQSKIEHSTGCVLTRVFGGARPDQCTCNAEEHNARIDAALEAAHGAGLDSELSTKETG